MMFSRFSPRCILTKACLCPGSLSSHSLVVVNSNTFHLVDFLSYALIWRPWVEVAVEVRVKSGFSVQRPKATL